MNGDQVEREGVKAEGEPESAGEVGLSLRLLRGLLYTNNNYVSKTESTTILFFENEYRI